MNTDLYKRVIHHRSQCPETHIPEYTCINHAKIDFIKYTIENIVYDTTYFGWVDFGYIRKTTDMPGDRTFQHELLKNNYVNMIYNNAIDENDSDAYYTLIFAPEKITGPFWFGSKEKLVQYWHLYHQTIQKLHKIGVADDDQAIMVHAYTHQSDDGVIKLWENKLLKTNGWFVGFLLFRP